jgi:hypothetical protein
MAIAKVISRSGTNQFNFDFTPFLSASDGTLNDSLATVTWTLPGEITSVSQTNTATVATIAIAPFVNAGDVAFSLNARFVLSVNVVTANSQNFTLNYGVVFAAVVTFPGVVS